MALKKTESNLQPKKPRLFGELASLLRLGFALLGIFTSFSLFPTLSLWLNDFLTVKPEDPEKKCFLIKVMSTFRINVIIVKVVEKRFFLMFPNKKNIIKILKPYLWPRFQGFKKCTFYLIHQNASICRREIWHNSCAQNLVFNFAIEFKVVILKHKCSHFH